MFELDQDVLPQLPRVLLIDRRRDLRIERIEGRTSREELQRPRKVADLDIKPVRAQLRNIPELRTARPTTRRRGHCLGTVDAIRPQVVRRVRRPRIDRKAVRIVGETRQRWILLPSYKG
jgi:hypothetical protein